MPKSLKSKIILMFLLPVVAIIYMSSVFVNQKYEQKEESSVKKLSIQITNSLSDLVHNLQYERGFSSGYLLSKTKYLENKLNNQYIKTDRAFNRFCKYTKLDTSTKISLQNIVNMKIMSTVESMLEDMKRLKSIRNRLFNSTISFKEEVSFYTNVNKKIIRIITMLNNIVYTKHSNSSIIIKLQNLKENAAIERAYMYNYLTSNKKSLGFDHLMKELQEKQKLYYKEFIDLSPDAIVDIFNNVVDTDTKNLLQDLRNSFKKNQLTQGDAKKWFKASSRYIEKLDEVLLNIFNIYVDNANDSFMEARIDLYVVMSLAIVSLIILIFMILVLKSLIKKEEKLIQNLRFASYAFNSHEAILVTDTNGFIIKVNEAFTKTMGYTKAEAIGKTLGLLKLNDYSDEFFKQMWDKIKTTGEWSGEISSKRKNGEIFPELLSVTAIKDSSAKTTNFIAQFLDISELKKAQAEIQYQADYDFLTGLMNRKSLTERLEEEFVRARRHNYFEAFLFIDLDNFKNINDNYGHSAGDAVLKEFSSRLKSELRQEDIIARISGDEFAIILTNSNADKEELLKTIDKICNKILDSINKVIEYENNKLYIGMSIGVSIFPMQHTGAQEVMNQADDAMYKAKHDGKNRYQLYK